METVEEGKGRTRMGKERETELKGDEKMAGNWKGNGIRGEKRNKTEGENEEEEK